MDLSMTEIIIGTPLSIVGLYLFFRIASAAIYRSKLDYDKRSRSNGEEADKDET